MTRLTADFFDRPTLTVARELLGMYLVRRMQGGSGDKSGTIALKITEVEAYDGFTDKASHAHRGQTPRNTPMFGKPGTVYVYFTYGIHWMLNIVCGKETYPAAVLIRAAGDIVGPARLTKALHIDKQLNGLPMGTHTGLWIENRGEKVPDRLVVRTPRIGVAYVGLWAKKPWRYVLEKQD